MHPSEPALEALLLRLLPGAPDQWQGASASEISALEAIAGRPLPAFYRWFLEKMGRSMGPMRYPTIDFSAAGILDAYAARQMQQSPRFLLIGYERDELMPLHYFYDLESPLRGDALVVRMLTPSDEMHEQFETFREMLAWGELWSQRVDRAPQQCRGTVRSAGELYETLGPLLQELGFQSPLETGAHCGLYERADATLLCTGTPHEHGSQAFGLGGQDAGTLARLLGTIADRAGIDVHISAWAPPLPGSG